MWSRIIQGLLIRNEQLWLIDLNKKFITGSTIIVCSTYQDYSPSRSLYHQTCSLHKAEDLKSEAMAADPTVLSIYQLLTRLICLLYEQQIILQRPKLSYQGHWQGSLFLHLTSKKTFFSCLNSAFMVIRNPINVNLFLRHIWEICLHSFSYMTGPTTAQKASMSRVFLSDLKLQTKTDSPLICFRAKMTYLNLLIFIFLTLFRMGMTQSISTAHTLRKYGREVAMSSWYTTYSASFPSSSGLSTEDGCTWNWTLSTFRFLEISDDLKGHKYVPQL